MTVITDAPIVKIGNEQRQMERLSFRAAFKFMGIVKKIGISKAITMGQKLMELDEEGSEEQNELDALASVAVILENITDVEQEIYEFGAVLLGATKEEVSNFPIDAFPEIIIGIKNHPDLQAFTKSLQMLMKAEVKATQPNVIPASI